MLSRRKFTSLLGVDLLCRAATIVAAPVTLAYGASDSDTQHLSAEEWLDDAVATKSLIGPLRLGRFLEPIYFLLESTSWAPSDNAAKNSKLQPITVPQGFVTDLASIPQVFFSVLRPDAEYAHAAIVHDYLYWVQSTDRETADLILKLAMQDLEVSPAKVEAIYAAVRVFGESAWKSNANLRNSGEHRVLKVFPSDPKARWSEWKVVSKYFK